MEYLGFNAHDQFSYRSFRTHRMDENTSFMLKIKVIGNQKRLDSPSMVTRSKTIETTCPQ